MATPEKKKKLQSSVLRANLYTEDTDPFCRLPLSTFFYRLEAFHLGNLMRLCVRKNADSYKSPLLFSCENKKKLILLPMDFQGLSKEFLKFSPLLERKRHFIWQLKCSSNASATSPFNMIPWSENQKFSPQIFLPQSREESKKKNPRKKSLSLLTRKENSCQIFRQLFHVYLRYRFLIFQNPNVLCRNINLLPFRFVFL